MPNTLPGQTTLATLRQLVADETDQPTPTPFTNVPIALYNQFINRSYRETVGLMVDSFQDYFINTDSGNPYTFLTNGTDYLYPLPNDHWKTLGVDCFWQPGNIQTGVTMREFMKLERNRFQFWSQSALFVPQYKITGKQLWLIPEPPPNNLEILVRYVPVLPDMEDTGTITIDALEPGDTILIAAQPTIPQGPPVDGVFPALPSQIAYVAIANGQSPVNVEGRLEFNIGATDGDTNGESAANLAAVMNRGFASGYNHVPWSSGSKAQDRYVAAVVANGPEVTISLYGAFAIVWSAYAAESATIPAPAIALSPLPIPTQANPYGAWHNFCDTLNGWDELTIADAAIKVLDKQDRGASEKKEAKAQLWARVRTEANNRNAAQNARVSNTKRLRGRPRGIGGGYGGY